MCCLPIRRMRFSPKSISKSAVLRPVVNTILLTLLGVGVSQAEALSYVGVQANAGGSQGFGGARSIVVSPNDKHVYVAAATDVGVGVFRRDNGGILTSVGFMPVGVLGVPVKVALSPDGKHVYGLYKAFQPPFGRLALYNRNADDGLLTFQNSYELDEVADLAVSNDGKHVYVSGANAIVVLSWSAITGDLSYADTIDGVDGLAGSAGLGLSPDGRHLYAAATTDSAVVVFERNAATGQLNYVETQRDNTGGVDGLGGAKAVALSPDGLNVYVAGASDDAIVVFKRDPASGKLTFLEALKDGINNVDGLNGVVTVAVSPNGSRVFAGAGAQPNIPDIADNAIAVFRRLPQSGKLEFLEAQKDGVNDVDGLQGVQSIALNPTGAYLFAAAPVDGTGKVSVFKIANAVPQAVADEAEVTAGESVILHMLANDSDPDNDVLRVSGADGTSKQGGVVVVNADNTITYTAPVNFTGTDTFNYFVSDARDATPQTGVVTLTVNAATPGPAVSAASVDSAEDGGGGSIGGLGLLLFGAGALRRRFVF